MFDGFRDVSLIGEGGLGRLYRATRESTGGVVAIKELREMSVGSPALHRARRELEALLRLKGHPYVVSVEEIIVGTDGPALVMEFAAGGSLMDRLDHGPFSAAELVLVGEHVTQALEAAHGLGIVHRDVKPHNLLVGSFGQVKVCDFGIAALFRDADARTQTQALTLAYASPEEIDGSDQIGPAADVYSFGATILHLALGRRLSFAERADPRAVTVLADGLDPVRADVVRLAATCLAHLPEQRPTIEQLSASFEGLASELGGSRLRRLDGSAGPTVPPVPTIVPASPHPAGPSQTPAPDADPTIIRPARVRQPPPLPPLAPPTVRPATPTIASPPPPPPAPHSPPPQPQSSPPSSVDEALAFFADALGNVAGTSILGNRQTMDEVSLLHPVRPGSRLEKGKVFERCRKLVSDAMAHGGATSGWVWSDDVRLPASWQVHYETLAAFDDGPAIVAFIEGADRADVELLGARDPSPTADGEVAYDIGEWTSTDFAQISNRLTLEGVPWYLDNGDLIVPHEDEALADELIEAVTGSRPV